MPSLLMHLLAVERLGIDGRLSPELSRALAEDAEYARLGAALPELPRFGGWPYASAHFAELFHQRAPVSFGLKLAELVSDGALVGREAGLAFLAGYLTHVCVDRAFGPRRESKDRALAQAKSLLGDAALRTRLQMTKRPGLPRGMGKGLYELVRVACQASWGEAPRKAAVDAWVRGSYLYAFALSGPYGTLKARRALAHHPRQEVYRGAEVDVPALLDGALVETRALLERVLRLIARGRFSPRTRAQLLEAWPDTALSLC
jgi:hypothetical protein